MRLIYCATLLLFSSNCFADTGIASYYGANPAKEHLAAKTASGEVFYPKHLTAASYKFYKKYVRVRSKDSGREIIVYVNDKGPNKRLGRLIDLTPWGFNYLCGKKKGLCTVSVEEVL